ncbi:hypothetical protein PG994_000786 [Apiospora phragmitis]|uniref:Ankyrin n=1 Tax=Apiospora phragmitis TaxID=2905665 RepID=A0ABR1X728_9PEZI
MSKGASSPVLEPRPLIDWIGKIADLRFLYTIFSSNTATLLEFWSKLFEVAEAFQHVEAFRSLNEVGLRIASTQWTQFCLQMCCSAYYKFTHRPVPLCAPLAHLENTGMIEILDQKGYHFSELPVRTQQRYLMGLLQPYEPQQTMCLRYLLQKGAIAAPVPEVDLDWARPGDPELARDYAWIWTLRCKNELYSELLEVFFEHGVRADDAPTVSGICRAAAGGIGSLKHYMETTPCPGNITKTKLLQVSLSETAAHGCLDILDCLLEYGVDPNVPSITEDIDITERSFESWKPTLGLDPQRFGDDDIIRATLFFSKSIPKGDSRLPRLFKIFRLYNISFDKKVKGLDLLQMAIQKSCDLSAVKLLLECGLVVHSKPSRKVGSTMLHDALRSNSLDRQRIVELLLDRGADPTLGDAGLLLEAPFKSLLSYDKAHGNVATSPGQWRNDRGFTALHAACLTGVPLSFIEMLLALGAQVSSGVEYQTETSLHCVVYAGHLNITCLLIAYGVPINATAVAHGSCTYPELPQHGMCTPLDYAAAIGDLEMVQLLYDLGRRSARRIYTEVDAAVQIARKNIRLGVSRFFEERIGGFDGIPDLDGSRICTGKGCWPKCLPCRTSWAMTTALVSRFAQGADPPLRGRKGGRVEDKGFVRLVSRGCRLEGDVGAVS